MIYEYAVDPELVATWSNSENCRYFIEKFGLGSSRILSRCPKTWKRRAWKAWSALQIDNELDKKRMVELIQRLYETRVVREDVDWNPDRSWTDNIIEKHHRAPFHAILAKHGSIDNLSMLTVNELNATNSRWNHPHGVNIKRTAGAIAEAVRDMLRAAADIVFVDPHFAPHHDRFVNVLDACLRACLENRVVRAPRIRIFGSVGDGKATFEFFSAECRKCLPHVLLADQKVEICRLQERTDGEKLHNRYILTELGGVLFATGLDEKIGDTDDLSLLARNQYLERWRQYTDDPPAFHSPEDVIVITGTRRP